MQAKVFLDTAYAIALIIKSDTFHKRAIRLADILTRQKTHWVTNLKLEDFILNLYLMLQ